MEDDHKMAAAVVAEDEDDLTHESAIRAEGRATDRDGAIASLSRPSRFSRCRTESKSKVIYPTARTANAPVAREGTTNTTDTRPQTAPPPTQSKGTIRRPVIHRGNRGPRDSPKAIYTRIGRLQYDCERGDEEDLTRSYGKLPSRSGSDDWKYSSPEKVTESPVTNEKQYDSESTEGGQSRRLQSREVDAKFSGGLVGVVGRHFNKLLTAGRRMISGKRSQMQTADINNNMVAAESYVHKSNTGARKQCKNDQPPVVNRSTSIFAMRKTILQIENYAQQVQDSSRLTEGDLVRGRRRWSSNGDGERVSQGDSGDRSLFGEGSEHSSETRAALMGFTTVESPVDDPRQAGEGCREEQMFIGDDDTPVIDRVNSYNCLGMSTKQLKQSRKTQDIRICKTGLVSTNGLQIQRKPEDILLKKHNDREQTTLKGGDCISQCRALDGASRLSIKEQNGSRQWKHISEANICYREVPVNKNKKKKAFYPSEKIKTESKHCRDHLELPNDRSCNNVFSCDPSPNKFAPLNKQKDPTQKLYLKDTLGQFENKNSVCTSTQRSGCENRKSMQNIVYVNNQMCVEINELQCRELNASQSGDMFVVTTDDNGNLILIRESELNGIVNVTGNNASEGKEDDADINVVRLNSNCSLGLIIVESRGKVTPENEETRRGNRLKKCVCKEDCESSKTSTQCCELRPKLFTNRSSQWAESEHDLRIRDGSCDLFARVQSLSPAPVSHCFSSPIRSRSRENVTECRATKEGTEVSRNPRVSRRCGSHFAVSKECEKESLGNPPRLIEGSLQEIVNRQALMSKRNDWQGTPDSTTNRRNRSVSAFAYTCGPTQPLTDCSVRRVVDRGGVGLKVDEERRGSNTGPPDCSEENERRLYECSSCDNCGIYNVNDAVYPLKGSEGKGHVPVTRLRGAGGGGGGSECGSSSAASDEDKDDEKPRHDGHPSSFDVSPHGGAVVVTDCGQRLLWEKDASAIGLEARCGGSLGDSLSPQTTKQRKSTERESGFAERENAGRIGEKRGRIVRPSVSKPRAVTKERLGLTRRSVAFVESSSRRDVQSTSSSKPVAIVNDCLNVGHKCDSCSEAKVYMDAGYCERERSPRMTKIGVPIDELLPAKPLTETPNGSSGVASISSCEGANIGSAGELITGDNRLGSRKRFLTWKRSAGVMEKPQGNPSAQDGGSLDVPQSFFKQNSCRDKESANPRVEESSNMKPSECSKRGCYLRQTMFSQPASVIREHIDEEVVVGFVKESDDNERQSSSNNDSAGTSCTKATISCAEGSAVGEGDGGRIPDVAGIDGGGTWRGEVVSGERGIVLGAATRSEDCKKEYGGGGARLKTKETLEEWGNDVHHASSGGGEVVIRVVGGGSSGGAEEEKGAGGLCAAVVTPGRGGGGAGAGAPAAGGGGSDGCGGGSSGCGGGALPFDEVPTNSCFGGGFALLKRCLLLDDSLRLSPIHMKGGCSVKKKTSHIKRNDFCKNHRDLCGDIINKLPSPRYDRKVICTDPNGRCRTKTTERKENPDSRGNPLKKMVGSIDRDIFKLMPEAPSSVCAIIKSAGAVFNFKDCDTTFLQHMRCDAAADASDHQSPIGDALPVCVSDSPPRNRVATSVK